MVEIDGEVGAREGIGDAVWVDTMEVKKTIRVLRFWGREMGNRDERRWWWREEGV